MPDDKLKLEEIHNTMRDSICSVLRHQKKDGSWNYHNDKNDNDSDVYQTYIAIWSLCDSGLGNTKKVKKSLSWINNELGNLIKKSSAESKIREKEDISRLSIALIKGKYDIDKNIATLISNSVESQSESGYWDAHLDSGPYCRVKDELGATLSHTLSLKLLKGKNEKVGDINRCLDKTYAWIIKKAESLSKKLEDQANENKHNILLEIAWSIRIIDNCDKLSEVNSELLRPLIKSICSNQNQCGFWGEVEGHLDNICLSYNCIHSLLLVKEKVDKNKKYQLDQVIIKGINYFISEYKDILSKPGQKSYTIRKISSCIIILIKLLKFPHLFQDNINFFNDCCLQRIHEIVNKKSNTVLFFSYKNIVYIIIGTVFLVLILEHSILYLANKLPISALSRFFNNDWAKNIFGGICSTIIITGAVKVYWIFRKR